MKEAITRRTLITGVSGLGLGLGVTAAADDRSESVSAEEALKRLVAGNRRFVEGKTQHAHASADWRKHLVATQKPFACILGCSDSRVPTELVFDQGFGDLFVVRVAGNVIATDVIGSLLYAVLHLNTKLIVVLGHQGCGAVTAALEALEGSVKEPPGVDALLKLIEPGLPKQLPKGTAEQRVNHAVEANVRWSIKQLARLGEGKKMIQAKHVVVRGAVYELATGKVRYINA